MIEEAISVLKRKDFNHSKNTHPDKTFISHIEECRKIVENIIKRYNFPNEMLDLALLLCAVHDIGKLLPSWSLNIEDRPLHSIEGAEWFLQNYADFNLQKKHVDVLAYFIASHHSSLKIPFHLKHVIEFAERKTNRQFKRYVESRKLCNGINSLLKEISVEERQDLVDLFGIVKMADIFSAKKLPVEYILEQYEWPKGLDDAVGRETRRRAEEKRGVFDEHKFEKQQKLAYLQERHLVLAAPTGWGKTAFSMLRMLAVKPVKVFYVLPTITAIKDSYDTFVKAFGERLVGEYFYFADVDLLKRFQDREEESWLLDFYRYFVPKITFTTIDQLLLTILQAGRYYTRRFNFRDALLVFDEYHLLTPEMVGCLKVFLKRFSEKYKFNCLFMSATPSPLYNRHLEETLNVRSVVLTEEYERLKRHKVELVDDLQLSDFIEAKPELLKDRRALLLVNTVAESQRLYRKLTEILGREKKVVLLHGDFAYKDRAEAEEKISSADVLVSTQVAEVSLDVSFDILATEMAPLPSLIQRFGRVNRYGTVANETNVFVCKPRSFHPYSEVAMESAKKEFPVMIEQLNKEGEKAYVNEMFWEHESIYEKDIVKVEGEISEKLENILLYFFSLTQEEEGDARLILNYLGREETYPAIPSIYLQEATSLYQKLRSASTYHERTRIYAEIKKFMVPASRRDLKNDCWSEELKLPVIEEYSSQIGIIRYRDE
ncbi:MAG: CRISPR-associated helicase Cas3' [Thermofilaceae archaeon]|nr:CRISPR-associated helicase Cas3' [Thermofilaceae archaeon]MCX8179960.1 CRISPR-associated helicase Cas3' [Thermofilaceae archaeon]MDW8004734.1 CRISPR-associated helicase Cas3' [Thermofilaceae archaeon]